MLKRTFTIRAVIALLAIAGVTTLTAACYPRGGHRPSPEKIRKFATFFVNDVLDDIEATDEQREAVQAVKDRVLAQGGAFHEGTEEARRAVLAELQKDTPDAARIHALIDARVDALRQTLHAVADEGLTIHSILTPAQRAQLAARIEERRGGR